MKTSKGVSSWLQLSVQVGNKKTWTLRVVCIRCGLADTTLQFSIVPAADSAVWCAQKELHGTRICLAVSLLVLWTLQFKFPSAVPFRPMVYVTGIHVDELLPGACICLFKTQGQGMDEDSSGSHFSAFPDFFPSLHLYLRVWFVTRFHYYAVFSIHILSSNVPSCYSIFNLYTLFLNIHPYLLWLPFPLSLTVEGK